MESKVLVTGASGLVGNVVANHLARKGFKVVGTYNKNKPKFTEENITSHKADLTKPIAWTILSSYSFDHVIHCAAEIPSSFLEEETVKIYLKNRKIDEFCTEFAKQQEAKLIYMSSSAVYGFTTGKRSVEEEGVVKDGQTYRSSKIEGEARIEKELPNSHFIFRLSAPYGGTRMRKTVLKIFIDQALEGKDLHLFGTGRRQQQFTHVDDIAHACYLAIQSSHPGIYNLASAPINMKDLANLIIQVTKSKSNIVIFRDAGKRERYKSNLDTARVKAFLGWTQKISLEEGLKRIANSKTFVFPLYTGPKPTDIKAAYDFGKPLVLKEDPFLCLVYQDPSEALKVSLKKAYKAGLIYEGLMEKAGIGRQKFDEFYSYIVRCTGIPTQKKILEIGSGTGYLLSKLTDNEVLGYEPGFKELKRHKVPVLTKKFPSREINGKKFNLILLANVLEHLPDLHIKLRQIKKVLDKDGKIIVRVPNCEEELRVGDPSILMHEHMFYFTTQSLQKVFESHNLKIEDISLSQSGSSIQCVVGRREGQVLAFSKRLDLLSKHFQQFLYTYKRSTLGVFVPLRALNLLHLNKPFLKKYRIKLRFFDDSKKLQGSRLPGFDTIVESGNQLIKNPVDFLIVYSYTYGDQIVGTLKRKGLQIPILTVKEMHHETGFDIRHPWKS